MASHSSSLILWWFQHSGSGNGLSLFFEYTANSSLRDVYESTLSLSQGQLYQMTLDLSY